MIVYQAVKWLHGRIKLSDLHSRHVLVTGCDTGFGNLLVKHLDKLGIPVFAGCLTEEGQEKLRAGCSSNVFPMGLDVTKEESVHKCVWLLLKRITWKRLQIDFYKSALIN